MKRIIIAGSIAAIAMVGLAGPANAAPSDPNCFGQIHKAVNAGLLPGIDNVGQFVQLPGVGGQGKKELVKGDICA